MGTALSPWSTEFDHEELLVVLVVKSHEVHNILVPAVIMGLDRHRRPRVASYVSAIRHVFYKFVHDLSALNSCSDFT